MGYYTDFEIEIISGDSIDYMLLLSNHIAPYNLDKDGCAYGIKWYNWNDDIKTFMKTYGENIILVISGNGEENGDLWRSYFHGDKEYASDVVTTYSEPPWLSKTKNKILISKIETEREEELALLKALKEKYEQ